jgi:hypothetical protein
VIVIVADVCVSKPADASPLLEVALPVACPDTVIGILKLPVKAARSPGDVRAVVCETELLVTGAKFLPLVPPPPGVPSNEVALKLSVTDGMARGIAPLGRLIERFAVVVPVISLGVAPRFSA